MMRPNLFLQFSVAELRAVRDEMRRRGVDHAILQLHLYDTATREDLGMIEETFPLAWIETLLRRHEAAARAARN